MRKAKAVILVVPLDLGNTLPEYAIWCQISPLSRLPLASVVQVVGTLGGSQLALFGYIPCWVRCSIRQSAL